MNRAHAPLESRKADAWALSPDVLLREFHSNFLLSRYKAVCVTHWTTSLGLWRDSWVSQQLPSEACRNFSFGECFRICFPDILLWAFLAGHQQISPFTFTPLALQLSTKVSTDTLNPLNSLWIPKKFLFSKQKGRLPVYECYIPERQSQNCVKMRPKKKMKPENI